MLISAPKRVKKRCPRRNLPKEVGRKRGESDFVLAFNRAFHEFLLSEGPRQFLCARELPVSGFGIADLICLKWPEVDAATEPQQTNQGAVHLLSFEMKLKDWKRGFAQACRYLFFSHFAILVLPPAEAELASTKLDLFKKSKVGLVAFDAATRSINPIHWPIPSTPRSQKAFQKAIGTVSTAFSSAFKVAV